MSATHVRVAGIRGSSIRLDSDRIVSMQFAAMQIELRPHVRELGGSGGWFLPNPNPNCRGLGHDSSGDSHVRGGLTRLLSCDRAHASRPGSRSRPSLGTASGRECVGHRRYRVDRWVHGCGKAAAGSRVAQDASDLRDESPHSQRVRRDFSDNRLDSKPAMRSSDFRERRSDRMDAARNTAAKKADFRERGRSPEIRRKGRAVPNDLCRPRGDP